MNFACLKQKLQDEIMSHVQHGPCHVCGGTGLNPKALASKINGKNIVDCMNMTAADLLPFLKTIDEPRGGSLARQITEYLDRMIDVGIGYLSLSRKTETLSGGEAQRIKMVRNLGGYLNNITYIFDEPTAGLHPADAERIGRMLCNLRDRHNNVLVVEHNRQILELADHIIEIGPGAGSGNSSLMRYAFKESYPDPIIVDQKPIGTSVRVPCKECGGHRYNPTALSYHYKGMNIEDVMSLTIRQAY